MRKDLFVFFILVLLCSCASEQSWEKYKEVAESQGRFLRDKTAGKQRALHIMSKKDLVYYLTYPKYAAGYRYNLHDSADQPMHCPSIIDVSELKLTYKYIAVYHVPHPITAGGYRFRIHTAASINLLDWDHLGCLVDNASMPTAQRVNSGPWILITYEQWMNSGPNCESNGPARIGFLMFYDANYLYQGICCESWVAPLYDSQLNGTHFYECRLEYKNSCYCADGVVGFHRWDGTRDVNCNAWFANIAIAGTAWGPSTAVDYTNKFSQVTGNLGQRATIHVTGGRFNIQEGNIGIPAGSWDKWRIWLYTFHPDNPHSWPLGWGTVEQIFVQTHNGSISIGNPSINIVNRPNGSGKAVVISYFIFGEEAGKDEAGSLLYYYNFGLCQKPPS